jgi:phenylpropionate dioxygenase-like ring-hydroxylating dioxygenase large terminal subunit
MRRERESALLERYLRMRRGGPQELAEASMRNPASAYIDPARFEREMAVLFRSRPVPLALGCECAAPGSFITMRLGDLPIAIVRQSDGSLRGFVNACRHRGAPVLAGSGADLRALVCPYHGWSYKLDGRLLARPQEWGFDDVVDGCGLRPIRVAEAYGLIYAHANPEADFAIADVLCGMETEIAEYNLANYSHFETRMREWDFNWKLIIDTFTENYHIPSLHRRSIAPQYEDRNSVWDTYGPNQRTVNFRRSIDRELIEKPDNERRILPHTTIEYFLMPNVVLTHQLDHIEMWRVTPLSVGRCLVATSLYAPEVPRTESAAKHWKKNLDALLRVTENEDFPMMRRIYEGLAAGTLDGLIYGKNEPALCHYHQSLDRLLAAATNE